MDKRLRIAGIAAAVAFSAFVLASPSAPLPLPLPDPSTTMLAGPSVAVLATGLDNPRSIAFAGGDVLVAEKGGAIRVVRGGALLDEPLAVLRAADGFSAGLLGIAAHPDFEGSPYVYAYHTYEEGGELFNKVLRLDAPGGRAAGSAVLVDAIPASRFSNGGAIAFGPDRMLYVGTGSVSDSLHHAQDAGSLAGKILRMDADGGAPPDNPSPGSRVYASGMRDPQGLAWDGDGRMYASDLGPSKNDEINAVRPGGNYGWPLYECSDGHPPGYEAAAACFDPSIEPGGLAVYGGQGGLQGLPNGSLLMASTRASGLYRVDLGQEQAGAGGAGQQVVLGGLGRIRDVAVGPDGLVYVITSNTDGKGFPDASDDRLVRIER